MAPFIKPCLVLFIFLVSIMLNAQSTFDPDTENVFTRFDKVKPLVEKWNNAINNNNADDLSQLYADTVDYYITRKSKKDCIDGKTKWITEHPGFKQRLSFIDLYYKDEDEKASVIIAELAKISYEKGDSSKVTGFLYFKKYNGNWKIFKESDYGSEVNKARKLPVSTLRDGKHIFNHSYTADFRYMPDVVYQLAGYSFTIEIEIRNKKITGEYNCYSGGLRENTNYLVPEGKIENGILELTMIWNGFNEYSLEDYNYDPNVPSDRKETLHFKIVNGNELICLDKDGYIGGKSLKLER